MTDKELGAAAGDIFAKAFTLGYKTGYDYALGSGMALTAEQVEDVKIVLGQLERGGPAFEAAHERLRTLFPATEPAEERCRKWTVRVAGGIETGIQCVLPAGHECFHDYVPPIHNYVPTAPAEPAEEHCTVPPEGWWCSRAANHNGPCAASEGVAPWVPQPLEADWLDQVDPRDPQSRTRRETAAAKFAEPAEEETKAEEFCCHPKCRFTDWGGINRKHERGADCPIVPKPAASPVVPAPTETGPWPTWQEVPDGVWFTSTSAVGSLPAHRKRGNLVDWQFRDRSVGVYDVSRIGNGKLMARAPFVAAEEGSA